MRQMLFLTALGVGVGLNATFAKAASEITDIETMQAPFTAAECLDASATVHGAFAEKIKNSPTEETRVGLMITSAQNACLRGNADQLVDMARLVDETRFANEQGWLENEDYDD